MKQAIIIFLFTLAASCSKVDTRKFEQVRVTQAGELVVIDGWLESKQPVEWVYIVQVMYRCEGGTPEIREYKLKFQPGQDYVFLEDQSSCKMIGWKLVYDDILRQ
jgi:hypothetical protein